MMTDSTRIDACDLPPNFPTESKVAATGPVEMISLAELERCLLAFQSHYERTASPFKWTFTRRDLHTLLAKIDAKRLAPAA